MARAARGPLLLAYVAELSLIHVPGAVIFLGEQWTLSGRAETEIGFRATLIALAALLCGAGFVLLVSPRLGGERFGDREEKFRRDGFVLLMCGLGAEFLVLPVVRYTPSVVSILYPAISSIVLGLWIWIWKALRARQLSRFILIFTSASLLPIATLVTSGFVGYGIHWMISALCFLFVWARRPHGFYVFAPIVLYCTLSLGAAYMIQRVQIREAVWVKQSGFVERLDSVVGILDRLEPFDPKNPDQASAIDQRMNQNKFIGLAIERLESGISDLRYGATVPPWAFVPRFFWPDKPEIGGGRSVVQQATGLILSETTSWGAGQVLEFFVNFGWAGLVGGFFALGMLLIKLDLLLARAFQRGDVRSLVLIGVPGLVLVQPGGNLLEIIVSGIAALITARLMCYGFKLFGLTPGPKSALANRGLNRNGVPPSVRIYRRHALDE